MAGRILVYVEHFAETYTTEPLIEFIKRMKEQLEAIPEECRENAAFETEVVSEYGSDYPGLKITYTRPETDEEFADRLQKEEHTRAYQAEIDARTLEAIRKRNPQLLKGTTND